MSESDDAIRRMLAAESVPQPAPVPPVELELARLEAAAGLVHEIAAERCRHCYAEPAVISVWPGTGLARAVEMRHETGCPDDA